MSISDVMLKDAPLQTIFFFYFAAFRIYLYGFRRSTQEYVLQCFCLELFQLVPFQDRTPGCGWVPCSPNSGNFSAKMSSSQRSPSWPSGSPRIHTYIVPAEFTPSSHQLFILFRGLFPIFSCCLEVFRTSSSSSLLSVLSSCCFQLLGRHSKQLFISPTKCFSIAVLSFLLSHPSVFSWCACHCLELIKHLKHFHSQILSRDYIRGCS